MKKSFMTRALATGLSFAMAFSLTAATNVTTASAAAAPAMKSSKFTVNVGQSKNYAAKAATQKNYKIKKVKLSTAGKTKVDVSINSGRKSIKVTGKEATAKTNVVITFKNRKTAALTKVTYKAVVKATEKEDENKTDTALAIESFSATKVNELTVTFKNAVDTANATIAVTKSSDSVATASTTWSADCKTLVIKTSANMINGTYKITVANGTDEVSATTDVTSQKVSSIKILNTVALTGSKVVSGDSVDSMKAYVYYDVLDQYGESMRSSTTIEWSTSCDVVKTDKTRGVLTVERTDGNAFTYGESIYVTGVHAKTGVSVTETLTVGQKQALNSVEVKGFVKKGTSEILTSLPSGFKSNAYYLVYSVTDQNGNEMQADTYLSGVGTPASSEVTFISDSVLIIKEISKEDDTVLTIDGVEYCAAFVEPGDDVNTGGEVTLTAIANKTGNKTEINIVVGDSQILKSFSISQPTGVVADGEAVEIPFSALDQNGNAITNFVTLASQSDFSRLQFNASVGTLYLKENDDGTAALIWLDTDDAGEWNTNSEDGIDRPVSLTAVVIGGDTANEMIYVSDKAMPVAIASVDMNSVYVQQGGEELTLSSFTFIDQYGRTMKRDDFYSHTDNNTSNENKGYVYDNGFFSYVNAVNNGEVDYTSSKGLSGLEFSGYDFGVKVEFKGTEANLETYCDGNTNDYAVIGTGSSIKHISVSGLSKNAPKYASGAAFQITSGSPFTVTADQTLKFSIEKTKNAEDYDDVSPVVNKTFKGVNIDRVSGFEIKDLNMFYVETSLSKEANAAVAGLSASDLVSSSGIAKLTGSESRNDVSITSGYTQKVKVTGKYNGTTVDVPKMYYTVAGEKLGVAVQDGIVSTGAINDNEIKVAAVTTGALSAANLYDVNSAQLTRKLATDTLKVTVYKASGTSIEVDDSKIVNTATKQVAISDAAPYAAEVCAADAYTVNPTMTGFASGRIGEPGSLLKVADANAYYLAYKRTDCWVVKDQYGVTISPSDVTYSYKVTQVVENTDRYAENNFTVNKNDTAQAYITGAELGDTFVLTISATSNGVTASKDITMTVGADGLAVVGETDNYYMDRLVKGNNGLEDQRKVSLGSN